MKIGIVGHGYVGKAMKEFFDKGKGVRHGPGCLRR